MEAAAATDIFCPTERLYNLRYTRFVGDGDTNSFKKKVFEAEPYGPAVNVEKN